MKATLLLSARICFFALLINAFISHIPPSPVFADESDYRIQRERMVTEQIERRGIKDQKVLEAMRKVERHQFIPEKHRHLAYADHPLPIPKGQTISQPYIVLP